jgi:hypothetical protein
MQQNPRAVSYNKVMRFFICILAALLVAGCADPGLETSDSVQREQLTPQEIWDQQGPVPELDPALYYASKGDTSRGIYCGNDPQLHRIGRTYLRSFTTLKEAKYAYPEHELFRSCEEVEKVLQKLPDLKEGD